MTNQFVPAETLAPAASQAPSGSAGSGPVEPWPGTFVRLDADEVFVRSTPAPAGAEPAVFVHGLGGSALNWTDLMARLAKPPATSDTATPAAVLAGDAIDLPGFGFSPPPANGDCSLNARVAAVISLIERRHGGPVHLIGNSLGGAISTRVAARRPDLVSTLTLISPALPDLRPRPMPARLALVAMPGLGRWVLNRMLEMPPERRADSSIAGLFADPSRLQPERRAEAIAEVIRRDSLGYSVDVLLASTRSLLAEYTRPGSGSLWHDAEKVTAPTLLIHGSHDRLVMPTMAVRAARTFPNCRVVLLPRVGHVAMMERPGQVAAEMREFLHWARPRQAAAGNPAETSTVQPSTVQPNTVQSETGVAQLDGGRGRTGLLRPQHGC
jgi:pimeloyl-ACP methyl ester carboxylesterase